MAHSVQCRRHPPFRAGTAGRCGFGAAHDSSLADKGVEVSFLTLRGLLRGPLVSERSRNVCLRLAQFERWKDAAFRLAFSRKVDEAKLAAQRRLMARHQRSHSAALDPDAADRLRDLSTAGQWETERRVR